MTTNSLTSRLDGPVEWLGCTTVIVPWFAGERCKLKVVTIRNVSQETFDNFRSALCNTHRATVTVEPQPEGQTFENGTISDASLVEMSYTYHPNAKTLDIVITHHAFCIGVDQIEEQLRRRIAECVPPGEAYANTTIASKHGETASETAKPVYGQDA